MLGQLLAEVASLTVWLRGIPVIGTHPPGGAGLLPPIERDCQARYPVGPKLWNRYSIPYAGAGEFNQYVVFYVLLIYGGDFARVRRGYPIPFAPFALKMVIAVTVDGSLPFIHDGPRLELAGL